MPCKCKQVVAAEIVGEINPQGLIEFHHSVCGEKFSRSVVICRCDTIEKKESVQGNIHYRGCPMYDAWVLMRKQQVRDRLDSASANVGPGELFASTSVPAAGKRIRGRAKSGQAKYLGSTKRGVQYSVKKP